MKYIVHQDFIEDKIFDNIEDVCDCVADFGFYDQYDEVAKICGYEIGSFAYRCGYDEWLNEVVYDDLARRLDRMSDGDSIDFYDLEISCEEEKKEDFVMTNIEKLYQSIKNEKQRSAWGKGVTLYALELVEGLNAQIDDGYFDEMDLSDTKKVREALLNGAKDWSQYSWGGCSLAYDSDIAERLCCPSELKKTRNGERRPNSREEWLDVQTRALYQAANRVCRHIEKLENSGGISYALPF